jgi:ADP-heptose:LPS heptosyltransferase
MTKSQLRCRLAWWIGSLSALDLAAGTFRRDPVTNRILLVRLDALGDFVLWLEAARALRKLYPSGRYHLTLLGNRAWTALAREISCFDEVWELDRRRFVLNPVYRFQLIRRVATGGFGVTIHPTFSRDFLWGDAMVRASGAPERIGFAGSMDLLTPEERLLSDRWYTRLIYGSPNESTTELRRNAEFIRALGLKDFKPGTPWLKPVTPAPADIGAEPFYILCPGANHAIRRWPVANFARLAEMIFHHTGWTGLVCGTGAEADIAAQLVNAASARLENYAGKSTLNGLVSIISRARLLIGNESGPIHLAAVLGTPCLSLLGGGHFGKFLPYERSEGDPRPLPEVAFCQMECFGCHWSCQYKPSAGAPAPCLTNITVEEVWNKTLTLLTNEASAPRGL